MSAALIAQPTDIVTLRKARLADVPAIVALVNGFADERVMLPRSESEIALALDDYVVAADRRGGVLACGALREYSPSVAEVSSIAVVRAAHRRGLGGGVVRAVEDLARKRGFEEVFLVTVTPEFFTTLGYAVVDRALYPEKICSHSVSIARCDGCTKLCMRRDLEPVHPMEAAA